MTHSSRLDELGIESTSAACEPVEQVSDHDGWETFLLLNSSNTNHRISELRHQKDKDKTTEALQITATEFDLAQDAVYSERMSGF